MDDAGVYAGLWTKAQQCGGECAGVAAPARGNLWSGLPDAQELLRAQGLQLLGSLCTVRRPSERSHQRSAWLRDALEQDDAAANRAGGSDATHADPRRTLQG